MSLPFRSRKYYGEEEDTLGEGTYGRVIRTDQGYAIKIISNDEDNIITSSTLHEIVSLLKVTSPYLIPIIDVIIDNQEETTNLVLPLADETLLEVMAEPSLDIKSLARQLCLGVAAIHNANLLHLDLKPANLLLHGLTQFSLFEKPGYDEAKLWIADLGISRMHTCAFPPLQEEFFTLWYRSPEILLGGPVTAKADVWAVGVILAELFLSKHNNLKQVLLPGDSATDQLFKIFRLLGTPTSGPLTTLTDWKGNYPVWQEDLQGTLRRNGLSPEEIDLVGYILNLDYIRRPNIFQVLEHPWFQPIEIPRKLTCFESLQRYAHYPQDKWPVKWHRQMTVDWLAEVVYGLKINFESYALAVYLLDRIESLSTLPPNEIQLYGGAALYISSSFYSTTEDLETFVSIADGAYTSNQLQKAINVILITTSFDLAVVTSYFFLSRAFLDNPNLRKTVIPIWRVSLLTPSHFTEPLLMAGSIIILADPTKPLIPRARRLLEEIMALPANLNVRGVQSILANRPRV